MKILFIASLYYPYFGGGAEVTLQHLVEVLAASGMEVVVLSIGPGAGLGLEEINGIRVWRAGIKNLYFHNDGMLRSGIHRMLWHGMDVYNPFMMSYVRSVVAKELPDVASCHNLTGWSISVWDALSSLGVPIVQVLHDLYLLCPRCTMFRDGSSCEKQCGSCRVMRFCHASKSRNIDVVVGVSKFILTKILDSGYFANAAMAQAIHNVRKHTPRILELPPSVDDSVTFGFMGTLGSYKGVELLLKKFIEIGKPNWRLRIAGTGHSDYEAFLKSTFCDSRICFLGQVSPDVFFGGLDVSVVPSLWDEPLGMVVVESLMAGVPVIGSRRGGIPELMCSDSLGMLFDPSDSNALSKAMIDMADNIWYWRSRRQEISACTLAMHSVEGWSKKWEAVYAFAANHAKNK